MLTRSSCALHLHSLSLLEVTLTLIRALYDTMKKIGSILALAAFCTGIVSARALPAGDSIIVRAPYPISKNLARIYDLSNDNRCCEVPCG
jgi:hypothetical protein